VTADLPSCQFITIKKHEPRADLTPTLVQFFRGIGWVMKLLQDSGNDTKSGKLFSGMGGRFHPESVAGLFRNGWQF